MANPLQAWLASGPTGVRPRVGLSPKRPQQEAGMRIDPPPSLPWASGHDAGGDGGRQRRRSSRRVCGRGPRGCARRPDSSGSV